MMPFKNKTQSFELTLDASLQVLFEEEPEVQLGQSSNRTKMGATTSMIKGSERPKHPNKPKRRLKKKSNTSPR